MFEAHKGSVELCAITASKANCYSVSRGLYFISMLYYCTNPPPSIFLGPTQRVQLLIFQRLSTVICSHGQSITLHYCAAPLPPTLSLPQANKNECSLSFFNGLAPSSVRINGQYHYTIALHSHPSPTQFLRPTKCVQLVIFQGLSAVICSHSNTSELNTLPLSFL